MHLHQRPGRNCKWRCLPRREQNVTTPLFLDCSQCVKALQCTQISKFRQTSLKIANIPAKSSKIQPGNPLHIAVSARFCLLQLFRLYSASASGCSNEPMTPRSHVPLIHSPDTNSIQRGSVCGGAIIPLFLVRQPSDTAWNMLLSRLHIAQLGHFDHLLHGTHSVVSMHLDDLSRMMQHGCKLHL